jgi:hypothetical protein
VGVDLSRIEAWTREKLEAEAIRRGIRSPEFRTRSELVRLILRHQYGERLAAGRELVALGARSVATARGALANMLGAAMASLPEPLDALTRLRGRSALGRERTSERKRGRAQPPSSTPTDARTAHDGRTAHDARPTDAGEPEPVVAREPEPTTAREPEPVAAREPDANAAREPEAAETEVSGLEMPPPGAAQEIAIGDRPTVRPSGEPPPLTPASHPESAASPFASPSSVPMGTFGPPDGSADGTFRVAPLPPPPVFAAKPPSTRTFVEEPIRTVSMARLLAAQGHRERSLAIYEELIAQNSEDASLRDEAQALRRGESTELPPLSAPPEASEADALPDAGDRLWCEGEPTQGMRLRWALSEHGQRRARAVLGRDGELAIRLVSIAFDPIRVVRSEITEHGPIDASGEWTAPALTDSARCFAAVGLRHGKRFVAVVHARPG